MGIPFVARFNQPHNVQGTGEPSEELPDKIEKNDIKNLTDEELLNLPQSERERIWRENKQVLDGGREIYYDKTYPKETRKRMGDLVDQAWRDQERMKRLWNGDPTNPAMFGGAQVEGIINDVQRLTVSGSKEAGKLITDLGSSLPADLESDL